MTCYVYVKLHERGGVLILAICDEDILGKSFREGQLRLDVNPEFYGGEKVTLEEALKLMDKANIINMVGRNIVEEAIRRGYVPVEGVITIAGVPHVQIVKLW